MDLVDAKGLFSMRDSYDNDTFNIIPSGLRRSLYIGSIKGPRQYICASSDPGIRFSDLTILLMVSSIGASITLVQRHNIIVFDEAHKGWRKVYIILVHHGKFHIDNHQNKTYIGSENEETTPSYVWRSLLRSLS